MSEPAQLDHIGIAVRDLAAAITTYETLLDCHIAPPEKLVARGISVAFVGAQVPRLELLGPDRPGSELARFLETRGEGIHHVCMRVADLKARVAQLVASGARLTPGGIRPGADGSLVAFIHPKDAHGVLLELMQPAQASL